MKRIILALLIPLAPFCANAGNKEIKLPPPEKKGGMPLMEALSKRESNRTFSSKELSEQTISNLLWAAFGINRKKTDKRTAPSARNKQEIDIYLCTSKGVYLYDAKDNSLKPALDKDIRLETGKQDFTGEAPACLVYVANFDRMAGSLEDKIFYSAADTGFISQNVYLFCASTGLNTVVLGYVDKATLKKIMNLGENQRIILTQPVGHPKKQ
jgi:SagB-type dehydrogenase family enzyme